MKLVHRDGDGDSIKVTSALDVMKGGQDIHTDDGAWDHGCAH